MHSKNMAQVRSKKRVPSGKGQPRRLPAPASSRAVTKALDMLELLRGSEESIPLGGIAAHVGLAKPSAYRLLHTLEEAGYLVADAAGRYAMPERVRPAVASRFLGSLLAAALPGMKDLVRQHRETVSLAALFENHAEVIAVTESPEIIRMGNVVGRILPPNASSLGKAIVAFQSEDRRERLIGSFGVYPFTEASITNAADLQRELELVRQRGFATDMEESVPHGCCYGVPVLGPAGHAIGAISVSMPKQRHTPERGQQLVEALRAAARRIENTLRAGR
jgi:DNA-binding IclR family transcriptional regulator